MVCPAGSGVESETAGSWFTPVGGTRSSFFASAMIWAGFSAFATGASSWRCTACSAATWA